MKQEEIKKFSEKLRELKVAELLQDGMKDNLSELKHIIQDLIMVMNPRYKPVILK